MEITVPSENYYTDTSRISNSNIGWFIKYGPAYLHKMLTNPPEEDSTAAMKKGTMIHMYLLQPEEFFNNYEVKTITKPKSENQKNFCELLANSVELEPNLALLSAYKGAYSTTGQTDDLVLSKAKEMASTFKSYITHLKEQDSKTAISKYDIAMLENIRDNVENHKLAKELLILPSKGETHHEFHINWEFGGVKCKSLLDSINFNIENKMCTIVDLKTTVHIGCFEESMKEYDYLRQLCFYWMAARWYILNELDENPISWEYQFYIVAIDTVGDNEIRVFKITEEQLFTRSNVITNTLDEIRWHQETGNWDHHREYYEGDGSETLEL